MTQTITLKVSMDCVACKRKVKKALDSIEGIDTIDVDMKNERVTVVGSVEPKVLVKKLAKVGKKVELPGGGGNSNTSSNNSIISSFKGEGGKKGGNKNSKNVFHRINSLTDTDGDEEESMLTPEVYTHFFSDENANSCSIM